MKQYLREAVAKRKQDEGEAECVPTKKAYKGECDSDSEPHSAPAELPPLCDSDSEPHTAPSEGPKNISAGHTEEWDSDPETWIADPQNWLADSEHAKATGMQNFSCKKCGIPADVFPNSGGGYLSACPSCGAEQDLNKSDSGALSHAHSTVPAGECPLDLISTSRVAENFRPRAKIIPAQNRRPRTKIIPAQNRRTASPACTPSPLADGPFRCAKRIKALNAMRDAPTGCTAPAVIVNRPAPPATNSIESRNSSSVRDRPIWK